MACLVQPDTIATIVDNFQVCQFVKLAVSQPYRRDVITSKSPVLFLPLFRVRPGIRLPEPDGNYSVLVDGAATADYTVVNGEIVLTLPFGNFYVKVQ